MKAPFITFTIRYLVATIFLSIFFYSEIYAQKGEEKQVEIPERLLKKIELCERYYEDGEYFKALQKMRKLHYKRKEFGFYQSFMIPYLAKYYAGAENYVQFEEVIQKMLKDKQVLGETTLAHGAGLLEAALLYAENTDANRASVFLAKSSSILGEMAKKMPFKLKVLQTESLIASLRGEYALYEAKSKELTQIYEQLLAENKGYYFDDVKNEITSRSLFASEKNRIQNQCAISIIENASAMRKQGKYEQAQQTLETASEWIQRHLAKTEVAFVVLQHEKALLMMDRGEEREKIRRLLEDNLYRAERKTGTAHKLYREAHEALIDYYMESKYVSQIDLGSENMMTQFTRKALINPYTETRYRIRGARQRWEMRKNSSIYYGKNRLPHAVSQRLDAKREYKNQEYNKAWSILSSLRKNTVKVPLHHLERIKILNLLHEIKLSSDHFEEAEQLLHESIFVTKNTVGEKSVLYHLERIKLANFYIHFTNKFASADSIFNESFAQIGQLLPHHSLEYTEALNQTAEYYISNRNYARAKELYTQGLSIMQEQYGHEHIRYAVQLQKLLKVEMLLSNYSTADSIIQKMFAIYEKENNPSLNFDYSEALETAARYYAVMGLYRDAHSVLLKAKRKYAKSNRSIASSSSLEELISLYIKMERFSEAEDILKEAIDIRRKRYGDKSRFLITPYTQMAILRLLNGDYGIAYEFADKGYDLAVELFGEKNLRTVEPLTALADYSMAIGDNEKAKSYIEQEVDIKKSALGDKHLDIANSLLRLALVKFNMDSKDQDIENLLQQTKDIIQNNLGNKNPVYAEALKKAALIYIEQNELDKAYAHLTDAEEIWNSIYAKQKSKNRINIAEISLLIGDVLARLGSLEDAEKEYEEARGIYEKAFNKSHPLYIHSISKQAQISYIQGNYKISFERITQVLHTYRQHIIHNFPAMSDREKSKYWSSIRQDFEFFNNLAARYSASNPKVLEEMYNNVLLTKSLLLSSSIKMRATILSSQNDSLINTYHRWVSKKDELVQALALSQEELKEQDIDIKGLQKEIESLEKNLSKMSDAFKNKEEYITWKSVQAILKEKEYALEIIRYRHFDKAFTDSVIYAGLFFDKTQKPKIVYMPEGSKMENQYLKFYRNSIEYKLYDTISYATYWRNIDNAIPDDAVIYFSGDGIYNQINLEAIIVNPEEEKYLIDKNNIILVTGTQDLVAKKIDFGASGFYVIGNPTYYQEDTKEDVVVDSKRSANRTISQLQGAEDEAYGVKEIFEGKKIKVNFVVNHDATEHYVKSIAKPKLFHIATHGFFETGTNAKNVFSEQTAFDSPLLRSGLLLRGAGDLMQGRNFYEYNKSDGVLTAYEVMNNLDFEGTELVVMSACETGRGDVKVGEGVYGLQRAFFVAGAKNLVMSLFKVDDAATKRLMKLFYDYWTAGKDKRTAFAQAKKQLREEFPEPIYWAPFIMVGVE